MAAKKKPTTAVEITDDRRKTHGDFSIGAKIIDDVMKIYQASPNWDKLTPVMRETIHMTVHKHQRILTGDPTVLDHWDDISGYNYLPRKYAKSEKK